MVPMAKGSPWRPNPWTGETRDVPSFVFPGVPTTKEGLLSFPKGALQSIIVGTKMSVCDRNRVRALMKKSGSGVALKVADLVPDRYEFEISTLK
jgi:hypothetical protein